MVQAASEAKEDQIKVSTAPSTKRSNSAQKVHAPLICRLYKKPLTTATQYEAVSWVWGDKKERESKSIKILQRKFIGDKTIGSKITGGKTTETKAFEVRIPKNLDIALQQLRDEKQSRFLWVDRLCIHQKDTKEVERQMAKMDRIYQAATNVCICVGTKGDNSDLVPTFVKKILNMESLDELTTSPDAVKRWSAFSTFMQRDCRCWGRIPFLFQTVS